THKIATATGRFEFVNRGNMYIKGKGEVETYFLLKSTKKSVWEIIDRERGNLDCTAREPEKRKMSTRIPSTAMKNSRRAWLTPKDGSLLYNH
ncbi:hypothetical protein OSTOST_18141, partial [Ostertagia ostertagi]